MEFNDYAYYSWERKVLQIASVKYGFEEDIVLHYDPYFYYEEGYTPRQFVEYVAEELFY